MLIEDRFTTRGIVALVFSCVSGILGVAVIAWYGFAEPVLTPMPAAIPVANGDERGEQQQVSSREGDVSPIVAPLGGDRGDEISVGTLSRRN